MGHPIGWPEKPSGERPFLWWDGQRWIRWDGQRWMQERNQSRSRGRMERQPVIGTDQYYGRHVNGDVTGYERVGQRLGATRAQPQYALPRSGGNSAPSAADDRRASIATLVLSALFALSLVVLLAGYGIDIVALRLTGVLGAFFFGVGAMPLKVFRHAGLTVRLAVAVLVGISASTLVASVMVLGPLWHPLLAAILLGTVAVILHVRASREALLRLRTSGETLQPQLDSASWLNLSTGITAVGTFWWLVSAAAAGHIVPVIGGFLTRISPMWYVGLLLVLGGIVLAWNRGEPAAIFGVVSLVAALTITPALAYGLPNVQWAAKHIGFVQQVLDIGHLDRHTGIYQAYSGFFSLSGWICDLAGTKDSVGLATYWPFMVGLAGLAVLRLFFGMLLQSTYRIYVALTLTFLVNAIGQNYFSPQSVGFVLAFGIFALAIGGEGTDLSRRTRIGLVVLVSCALAVTHEFSPYMVAVVLGVFVVAKIVRPIYFPLITGFPAVLWALLNWSVLRRFVSLSGFALSNFTPPKTVATPGLARLPIVGQGSDAMLASLLVLIFLAAIGFLAAVTRRPGWEFFSPRYAWAMLIAAGSGLFIIAANPYGNEGIFRAALFAIPWLAALAVTSVPQVTRDWLTFPFAVLLTGLAATYCLASFGLDNGTTIRQGDVKALEFYTTKASSEGHILNLSYGYTPTGMFSLGSGNPVAWSAVVPQSDGHVTAMTGDSATILARNYLLYVLEKKADTSGRADTGPGELYAIWSPASVHYAIDYGLETAATARAWLRALASSSQWKLVYSDNGTYLFRLVL